MTAVEGGDPDDVRDAIVAAAAHLLRRDGATAVTTRAVAREAGVQAPAIYRLFGDKDGLIDAVAEHVMAGYAAEQAAAVDDSDPVTALRVAWDEYIEFGLAHRELAVLLNAPGRAGRSPATAAGIRVLRTRLERVAAAGLLRVTLDRAVDVVHAIGTGTVFALLNSAEPDPGLADATFDAVEGAILTTAPAPPDPTVTTAAVTFLTVVSDLPALTAAERALMVEWIHRALAELQHSTSRR